MPKEAEEKKQNIKKTQTQTTKKIAKKDNTTSNKKSIDQSTRKTPKVEKITRTRKETTTE